MIAIPAVDLREGHCVQLVGGDYDHERVRLEDPAAVARRWTDAGFRRIHVVDLDAAMGRGSNADTVDAILADARAAIQVGGGLRTTDAIDALLQRGVDRVVVGTRALTDGEWLADVANRWPDRVVVAADARDGVIVTHGWTASAGMRVVDAVAAYSALPLAAILVTAVDREGRMAGPDASLVAQVVAATPHRVIASGGIGSMDDLRALAGAGAHEAVIGMALYTGALDPRAVAQEFDS